MKTVAMLSAAFALTSCAPVQDAGPTLPDNGPPQCGAAANQSLVGQNVAAVSFPAGANVRVVCTTCPATMDYSPGRMNVRFDQATGIIKTVDCG